MNDDELRARLRAADPARTIDPASSWTDDEVEAVMEARDKPIESRRTWGVVAAVAAVVVAAGAGSYAVLGGGDGGRDRTDEPGKPGDGGPRQELALTVPAPDAMQMCMQFSVDGLRPMELAFSGTVAEVEGEVARIETDHWYKGGDADVVTLHAPSAAVLLEGGITFAEGERYLVTATSGTVSSCGFSGPWTEEMAAAYDEAF